MKGHATEHAQINNDNKNLIQRSSEYKC